MMIPDILKELLKAQEHFDSVLYSNCFSEEALVFDEGKTYRGRGEIKDWNERSNKEYQSKMEIIDISTENEVIILRTNVSGTFDGSPITLKFHFKIENEKISELKITG